MALKTLVIGNGSCAFEIVDSLLSKSVEVVIATRENSLHQKFSEIKDQIITEIHTETTIHSCTGSIGNFTISMKNNNNIIIRTVDSIVIAEESFRKTFFDSYGLSPSTKTISLSDLENKENYKNITDENKRTFYKNNAVHFLWDVDTLTEKINSGLYEKSRKRN